MNEDRAGHVHDVLIIGSGFGGQAAAVALGREGIDDFVILERRDFVGGTWCQNSYPGAAVDVQSHLYSLSFEPYPWSQVFAAQDELEEYTNHVIDKYGLRERILLGRDVEDASWDDVAHHWTVRTSTGEVFRARAIISASGILSSAIVPDFPGKDSFTGVAFHTNDWDHDVDLAGKRVAIVGSGASAAQVIPAIADEVAHLHVFQRTPHWVMPRRDRVFGRLEKRIVNSRGVGRLIRSLMYWRLESRIVAFKYSKVARDIVATRAARRQLRRQVKDPVLRAKLTPGYEIGCKRIILSDTLYPTLSREDVTLHDRNDGIAEVTPTGITTTTGTELDLDVIIWATGYDGTDGVVSYPVHGRGGRALSEAWAEYPRAYLGTTVPGFPNIFFITGPNTGIGHTSAIFIIEAQLRYVMSCLRELRSRGAASVEVTAAAEDAYTRHIHSEMTKTVWDSGGCDSWYKHPSGKVIAMYPGFSVTYRRHTAAMRPEHHEFAVAAGTPEGATASR